MRRREKYRREIRVARTNRLFPSSRPDRQQEDPLAPAVRGLLPVPNKEKDEEMKGRGRRSRKSSFIFLFWLLPDSTIPPVSPTLSFRQKSTLMASSSRQKDRRNNLFCFFQPIGLLRESNARIGFPVFHLLAVVMRVSVATQPLINKVPK